MSDLQLKLVRLITYGVGIAIFLILSIRTCDDDFGFASLMKEYPIVVDSIALNHKIKEVVCPPKLRCKGAMAVFLILDDGRKIYVKVRQSDISPEAVMSPGDSIFKDRGSDSLFLYKARGENFYAFILKKD